MTTDYKPNIVTKDGISYDLNIEEQKDAYDLAYDEVSGWMKGMKSTLITGAKREYYASEMTSTPEHPNRSDFGYSSLSSGSTIFVINGGQLYMFDEFANSGIGEWVLL